jgi:hypothetical protein
MEKRAKRKAYRLRRLDHLVIQNRWVLADRCLCNFLSRRCLANVSVNKRETRRRREAGFEMLREVATTL